MIIPDPFSICLATAPLIFYLLFVGGMRILGRPLVITFGQEIAMLGFAVSGLVAVGPAQLFFPIAAGTLFQNKVWLMLGAFYFLGVTLTALTVRPSISVVGRTSSETFPALARAAAKLEPSAEIDLTNEEVYLPQSKIRLRIDSIPRIDHSSVVAFEPRVSPEFWRRLVAALRVEASATSAETGGRGIGMLASAAALMVLFLYQAVPKRELLVEGFRQWFDHQ